MPWQPTGSVQPRAAGIRFRKSLATRRTVEVEAPPKSGRPMRGTDLAGRLDRRGGGVLGPRKASARQRQRDPSRSRAYPPSLARATSCRGRLLHDAAQNLFRRPQASHQRLTVTGSPTPPLLSNRRASANSHHHFGLDRIQRQNARPEVRMLRLCRCLPARPHVDTCWLMQCMLKLLVKGG